MTEKNEIQTFKIVNKTVTVTIIFNKGFFNHQFKSSNDFITVLLNNLQKYFYTL